MVGLAFAIAIVVIVLIGVYQLTQLIPEPWKIYGQVLQIFVAVCGAVYLLMRAAQFFEVVVPGVR